MDLFLLGAGMGVVGGLLPNPIYMIALAQIALNRWLRAILILLGPPLLLDAALLVLTLFFYHYVPSLIAHYVAYLGGVVLVGFGAFSLFEMRRKSLEEMADSTTLTYASVTVAALSELTAPGTWVYWLTIAGPILAEGKQKGYWHVVPFFAGGLVSYYAASLIVVGLMAWGASFHQKVKQHLFLIANLLLLVLGISYLLRAHFGG